MQKPDQEFLENVADRFKLPIALLGAGFLTVLLVASVLAMIESSPHTAGTESGPVMYWHHSISR